MRKKVDTISGDLFLIPRPVTPHQGALACRAEIAGLMSDALKGFDRYEVASEMSKLLGREISKNMLDAYTAESREDHIPPLDTAIAFDTVVGGHRLLDLAASKLGARISVGKDALLTQLGQFERARDEAAKQIKKLKGILGETE